MKSKLFNHSASQSMRIPILAYHMVNDNPHPSDERYCCRVDRFKRQMQYLNKNGYEVVGLDEILDLRNNNATMKKYVAITFDDGYMDNYIHALPVLAEFGFKSTVFVVTDLVGGTNIWTSSNRFAQRQLMSWEHIRDLGSLHCTVGSHTKSHPDLVNIDPETARAEIGESKTKLEDKIGRSVEHFAYPYGKFSAEVGEMVRQNGYVTACSARSGFNTAQTDPYALRRLEVYGSDNLFNFKAKLLLGTNDGSLKNVCTYYRGRILSRMPGL